MLTHTIALLTVCICHPQDAPDAKKLIEKMLARYHDAKTLTGTIKLTVTAAGGSAKMDTALQFERPAKFYLSQQKNVANPDPETPSKWLVTSDGQMFSYNIPNDQYESAPGLRLGEPVFNTRTKTTHTIATIYGASSKSIGDRSMPLDVAVGGQPDLLYRIGQWQTRSVKGKKMIGDISTYLVSGSYRPYASAEPVGTYQMAISEEGDLLQYVEEQYVAVDGRDPVKVHSQWDVQLKVDGKVDPTLFKVIIK